MIVPVYLAISLVLGSPTLAPAQDRAKDLYDRAAQLERDGNYPASLSLLWEAAGLAPRDAEIQNRLGEALERIGALDAAVVAYRTALQQKPEFRKASNNLILALVKVGRGTTVILVFLGLAWIPFMKYISPQIYIYLQSVQAYIAPPVAACFLLGILYPRLNGSGAITSLGVGFVLGALRLILELDKAHLTPGSTAMWFASINFLHFAALLFVLCALVLVGVSLATPPPAPERAVHA
jgi:tetratricopeptide (TPR) repeat protein